MSTVIGALRCEAPGCVDGTVTVLSGPINGDPWPSDTEREVPCEDCRGTGVARCSSIGCREAAVTVAPDGWLVCQECDEAARGCEGAAGRGAA